MGSCDKLRTHIQCVTRNYIGKTLGLRQPRSAVKVIWQDSITMSKSALLLRLQFLLGNGDWILFFKMPLQCQHFLPYKTIQDGGKSTVSELELNLSLYSNESMTNAPDPLCCFFICKIGKLSEFSETANLVHCFLHCGCNKYVCTLVSLPSA